jgi:hypothetical protein
MADVKATGDDVLDAYVQELVAWENDLKPFRDLWDELWGEWHPRRSSRRVNNVTTPDRAYLSQVHVPYTFHAVETLLPRVVGQDPRMTYRAVDDNDDAPVAAIQGGLTTWQMERMGFEHEVRGFCRQGLVTGYSIAKVGWLRQERMVKYMQEQPHYEEMLDKTFRVEAEQEKLVTVKNQPFFETVNVQDFVWPVWSKDIPSASAVYQRRWVTKGYLRELAKAKIYNNVEDVQADDHGVFKESREGQFDPQAVSLSATFAQLTDDDGIVEIWERWTNDNLCVIASPHGHPVKLRDVENPFQHNRKPFVDWSPIPHPFQMPGLGVIDIIYEQNEHLDTIRRQISDARTYILNPAWKGTEGIGQEQLSLFPGKYVEVDDLNDLEPLFMPSVNFEAAWREEQETKEDMQRTSGAFEYLAGGEGTGAQTATGVATITNEGNKRVAEMIKVLSERTMKPFGVMLAAMNAQFIDADVAVDFSKDPNAQAAWQEYTDLSDKEFEDLKGKPLVNVTPEMVKAKGRLEPLPEVGADKAVNDVQQRSDATQVAQVMAPFLATPIPTVNPRALVAWILEQFGVSKVDREKMIADMPGAGIPPEILQVLQQRPDLLQALMLHIQEEAAQQAPQPSNGTRPSGGGGEGGENAPTSGVVGAAGAAGVM